MAKSIIGKFHHIFFFSQDINKDQGKEGKILEQHCGQQYLFLNQIRNAISLLKTLPVEDVAFVIS